GHQCETLFIDYSRIPGYTSVSRYNLVDSTRFLHFETEKDQLLGSYDSIQTSDRYVVRKTVQTGWIEVQVKLAPMKKKKENEGVFGPNQAKKQQKRAQITNNQEQDDD
ncbi:MAG: hypothetical protein EZS28_054582, partial [Streblomastix strix]